MYNQKLTHMKQLILAVKGIIYFAFLLCIGLNSVHAQNNIKNTTITGTITDKKGNTLPSVNVIVKGTKISTNSDFDGKYSLTIPETVLAPSLVFSYIGFTEQTELVGNQSQINASLQEETNKLDEVIVVGYGKMKKSDVTGAISSVRKESIEHRTTASAAEALQGLVSGVNVQKTGGLAGGGVSVKIRGVNTFGNTEPLYIIDGFQGSINTVSPNDIESMEVLKDGAAAAIYGSLAANGVILVTTKNGQKDGVKVDFTAYLNSSKAANQLEMLDAKGYQTVTKNIYDNYNQYSSQPVALPTYITAPAPANTNWQDEVFRTGLAQNYGLGIQGKDGNVKYALYGNLVKEEGIVIGNDFERQNASARLSFKKSIFDIDAKMAYVGTQSELPVFQLKEVYSISPLVPVYDTNETYGYGLTNKNGLPSYTNPVAEQNFNSRIDKGQDFTANFGVTANINSWIKYKIAYSYRVTNNQLTAHNPPYIANNKEPHLYTVQSNTNTHWDNQILDNILTVDKTFGDHSFNLMLGTTLNEMSSEWTAVEVEGKTTNYNVENGQIVTSEQAAGFLDSSFETIGAGKGGTYNADGSKYQYNRLSYFGRLNYSYKDRYLLQMSLRHDGSSKFGENSRYGTFPSIALGWKIEKEEFYPADFFVSNLKLRASWGQLGSESALGYYSSNALITTGNNLKYGYVQGDGNNPWAGSIATTLENKNLQWETTDSKNIGIDYTVKGGKISGSINYYYNTTQDLLITKKIAPSAGINDPILNVGEISNRGFEFEINYRNKVNEFNYNVGFNLSTLQNKVVSLANEGQVIYGEGLKFGAEHFPTQAHVGKPISAFYLYQTDGIFQSMDEVNAYSKDGNLIQPDAKPGDIRFKDLDGNGVIDEEDKAYSGTGLPKLEANLILGANYMGFDMSALLGSAWGNKLYNGNRYFYESMNNGTNMLATTLNAWTPENHSDIPRAVLSDPNGNSRESTRFLENGNFIRLRQLQFGYTIPKKLLAGAKIDKLRFYVGAENLFTITKYQGIDPEFSRSSVLNTGVDRFVYPFTKSFVSGVQFNF
jgi:TonB-linked SusC/RagA family outer membrane protein